MVEIIYGQRVSGLNDVYVEIAERASTETVEAGSPGASMLSLLMGFFPWCEYTPYLRASSLKLNMDPILSEVLSTMATWLRISSQTEGD